MTRIYTILAAIVVVAPVALVTLAQAAQIVG